MQVAVGYVWARLCVPLSTTVIIRPVAVGPYDRIQGVSVLQLPQTRIKYFPDVSLCRVRREALLLDEVQQFISLDGLHVTRAPRTHR
jgi:hypothetical protein